MICGHVGAECSIYMYLLVLFLGAWIRKPLEMTTCEWGPSEASGTLITSAHQAQVCRVTQVRGWASRWPQVETLHRRHSPPVENHWLDLHGRNCCDFRGEFCVADFSLHLFFPRVVEEVQAGGWRPQQSLPGRGVWRRHQRDGDLPEPQADRRAVLTLIPLHLPYHANSCYPSLCLCFFCFLLIAILLRHLLNSLITTLSPEKRGFFYFYCCVHEMAGR